MDFEKISSLHDDVTFPFDEGRKPDYDVENYPARLPDPGPRGEFSVLNRIRQFGVTDSDLNNMNVDNLLEVSKEEYDQLIIQALKRQYDVIFPSVFAHWKEIRQDEQWELVKRVSENYQSWGLNLVEKGDVLSEDEPNLVISLEGADFVRSHDDITALIEAGIRSIILQYNLPNAMCGEDGLTTFGKEAVNTLLDKNIIVDLAHALPRVRTDILQLAEKKEKGSQVAYTHGAYIEDMERDPHLSQLANNRGITEAEVQQLLKIGGIIGLGVTRPFFQSVPHLAERIDSILQLENGPQSLALGMDLGGVTPAMEVGIGSPEDVAKLANILADRFNCPDATIKAIIRDNARQWLSNK